MVLYGWKRAGRAFGVHGLPNMKKPQRMERCGLCVAQVRV